jgi:hypothetical protein
MDSTLDGRIPRILEELNKSRDRIAELTRLLAEERERGKALYAQFTNYQNQLASELGLVSQTGGRRRSTQSNLSVSAGKIVGRSYREGKTSQEARRLAVNQLGKLAKAKYGLSEVPESVLEILEDQIERLYGPPS